jgi:hypothetical protein
MFFIDVFVVHLVGTAHRTSIAAVGIPEDLKTLVDKDIVNQKVGKPIGENAQSYGKANFKYAVLPQQKKANTYKCIEDKKGVVALKPGIVVLAMMVAVQVPQKAMHHVLMRKPRHKFHDEKSEHKNQYIKPHSGIL